MHIRVASLREMAGFGKRGQLGPQGLEDIPLVVMAFIAAVGAIIIFIDISSARLAESRNSDIYFVGKRLVERLAGEEFKSDVSRAYGSRVLDGELIDAALESGGLDGIKPIEYGFSAEISTDGNSWIFGGEPPSEFMAFSDSVTILSDGLHDGRIVVKLWPKRANKKDDKKMRNRK